MKKACTNCRKKYENGEHCNQCGKTLGAEFICVKIRKESAHFCSRRCANKIAVAASYPSGPSENEEPPQGYACKKCGYHWMPSEAELNPKFCPECASPNFTQLNIRAAPSGSRTANYAKKAKEGA